MKAFDLSPSAQLAVKAGLLESLNVKKTTQARLNLANKRFAHIKNASIVYYDDATNTWIALNNQDNLFVYAFTGKQTKAILWAFHTEEARDAHIKQWLKNIEIRQKQKQVKAESGKTLTHEKVNIGDVFYCSWGYEQTNINYYQVVGKKGKTVLLLKEIYAQDTDNSLGDRGYCVPCVDAFKNDEILEKRVLLLGSNEIGFKAYSYANARPLDKKPNGEYRPLYWSNYH